MLGAAKIACRRLEQSPSPRLPLRHAEKASQEHILSAVHPMAACSYFWMSAALNEKQLCIRKNGGAYISQIKATEKKLQPQLNTAAASGNCAQESLAS
jgi:hypothetical protein